MCASPVTKISKGEALEAAYQLVSHLYEADDINQYLSELCLHFSGAARTEILTQARVVAGKKKLEMTGGALAILTGENLKNQRAQGFEALVKSLMQFASAVNQGKGRAFVIAACASEVSNAKKPDSFSPALKSLGIWLRASTVDLTQSLRIITNKATSTEVLRVWANLAMPAMGNLGAKFCFKKDECCSLLESLSELEPEIIPESIAARFPLLVMHASKECADQFLCSSIGRLFFENQGDSDFSGHSSPSAVSVVDLTKEQRYAIELIEQTFADQNQQLKAAEIEQRNETEALRQDFAKDIRNADETQRILRKERNELRHQNYELEQKKEKFEEQLSTLKIKLAHLNAEIQQLNRELISRRADQSDKQLTDLRKYLIRPAGNLRDSIKGLAQKNKLTPDFVPVVVAFDQMHRQLIKLTGEKDEQRLPKELLKGS